MVDRAQESLETGCGFMCTALELYNDRTRCQLERHVASTGGGGGGRTPILDLTGCATQQGVILR